jgi:translation initiation factor IF-3
MVGVTDTRDALQMALDAGLDLVEVSPEADPPVCRILDFGKYRYEQSKKEKSNRAKSKTVEMKEIRLGRSMKIDPHDVGIRLAQARKFLMDGHKVQIVQNFRGREMLHKERGNQRMKEVVTNLADISKVEMAPRMAGRRMTLILSPDKSKIDRIKAVQAKAAPVVSQPLAAPLPETDQPPAED